MEKENKWWEKEPLRIFEIATCSSDSYAQNPFAEAEAMSGLIANVQHMHCMGVPLPGGLDDEHMFFKTKGAKTVNRDYLKDYLPEAHKRGIRVIVYFNVHWYSEEFGKQHPDWLQIKEDGKPINKMYGTAAASFCVNGSWRNWAFQIVEDLAGYEIDGIFFDGPIFFADTCYCQSCQELFKEICGCPLPLKSERKNPLWRKLVEFQSDSIAGFLKDSQKVLKEKRPEALLYMNGNSNWPFWPTGRDNRKIIRYTDILGAEGGFLYGDLSHTPIYKPGITAKLLETQAGGKPAVVFDSLLHRSWNFCFLPEAEISLLYSQTIANGANVWAIVFPQDDLVPKVSGIETARKYNNFIKENSDVYLGAKSMARIALLWPSKTANFYEGSNVPFTDFTKEVKAEEIGNLTEEFNGFYDALVRTHLPFNVIDEVELENSEAGKRYDLIILPNAGCLGEKEIENIRDFVRNGGNLIATFETSLYNEYGERLPDFQLKDLFGVNFAGELFGPMKWDHISRCNAEDNFLKGVTKKYLPAPTYGVKVKTSNAKELLLFCERLKCVYGGIPSLSKDPFLVVNKYGQGKVVYLAGMFGGTLSKFRFSSYYQLVYNLGTLLSEKLIGLKNVFSSLEVILRRKRKRIFIHLINFTSEMKRPIEKIVPLENVKICLNFSVNPKVIRALWTDEELSFEKSPEGILFSLPVLNEYEVVVIEE